MFKMVVLTLCVGVERSVDNLAIEELTRRRYGIFVEAKTYETSKERQKKKKNAKETFVVHLALEQFKKMPFHRLVDIIIIGRLGADYWRRYFGTSWLSCATRNVVTVVVAVIAAWSGYFGPVDS